jgi:hypothetical protein
MFTAKKSQRSKKNWARAGAKAVKGVEARCKSARVKAVLAEAQGGVHDWRGGGRRARWVDLIFNFISQMASLTTGKAVEVAAAGRTLVSLRGPARRRWGAVVATRRCAGAWLRQGAG